MIRIHFTYRHVDKPWGGANNFIRALRGHLCAHGRFQFTPSMTDRCDIVFMNQLAQGPAGGTEPVSLEAVRALMQSAVRPKLVVRAVNLNLHAFTPGLRNLTVGWWNDRKTVSLLNLADVAIFQSAYQREFFIRAGYRAGRDVVIHNGADRSFCSAGPASVPLTGPLRCFSSTASPRATKRHDLIARLSQVDGVEVVHVGAWPQGLDPQRVRLLGTQPRERLVEAMAGCHVLFHPAIKDPCPNSVFEAMCVGLPVVYHPGPGSSAEIVGPCGLALDESRLDKTVERVRRELAALREAVASRRHLFSIDHAATRYCAAFERVAQAEPLEFSE